MKHPVCTNGNYMKHPVHMFKLMGTDVKHPVYINCNYMKHPVYINGGNYMKHPVYTNGNYMKHPVCIINGDGINGNVIETPCIVLYYWQLY